jgi:hypothetical protein
MASTDKREHTCHNPCTPSVDGCNLSSTRFYLFDSIEGTGIAAFVAPGANILIDFGDNRFRFECPFADIRKTILLLPTRPNLPIR